MRKNILVYIATALAAITVMLGNLISDVLPFSRLWYGDGNAVANAVGYAMHYRRPQRAVIRVYDDVGNVIETHTHRGNFKEW